MNIVLNNALQIETAKEVKQPLHLVFDYAREKATFEDIAVVGLGYVGLPLAVHLAEKFENVVGFDISQKRVAEIHEGLDATNEVETPRLQACGLMASDRSEALAAASFYIVTVPTPITDANQPDLSPLKSACEKIGPFLKKGDLVVFESTVYPGVTEDFCAPLLEKASGLISGVDFGLGYSAERINPGDKVNTVDKVIKVVSGDSAPTLERVKAVYETVIAAGLHAAPSIKVAEAAKVLENTQRDVNIALMNEMSMICDKIGIDTRDVIEAAATKWNFMPFTPGLVGGHCIGVDPYYLVSLAEQVGHNPQVIMSGRRINDGMARHVVDATIRLLIEQGGDIRNKRVAVCGITFKEDVPDVRNSKALELIDLLRNYGIEPLIHDPHCTPDMAAALGLELCSDADLADLDAMVLTTAHKVYTNDPQFLDALTEEAVFVDVKGAYRNSAEIEELRYWSL